MNSPPWCIHDVCPRDIHDECSDGVCYDGLMLDMESEGGRYEG